MSTITQYTDFPKVTVTLTNGRQKGKIVTGRTNTKMGYIVLTVKRERVWGIGGHKWSQPLLSITSGNSCPALGQREISIINDWFSEIIAKEFNDIDK